MIQTGLTTLQKDHNNAILTFNVSYLVLLVEQYRKLQRKKPLPHLMRAVIDDEIRTLIERMVTDFINMYQSNPNPQFRTYFMTKHTDALDEVTKIDSMQASVYDQAVVELLGTTLTEAQKFQHFFMTWYYFCLS
jgi:hypothetical protein